MSPPQTLRGSGGKVAAVYGRTSNDLQKTCDSQIELCRDLIKQRGWVMRYQLKDEGERGWQSDRPAYQRLLDIVQEGHVDVIVVWKLDRLFRSLREASTSEELLRDAGVSIVSVTEPFDTSTPIGRFMFGFLANMAAFETEVISDRVKLGRYRMAKEGRWPNNNPPYGYRVDGKLALSRNEEQTALVRRVFRWYNQRVPTTEIARRLRARGLKGARGGVIGHQFIVAMVRNPIYRGFQSLMGFEHQRPDLRIVRDATWFLAQARKGDRCEDSGWKKRRNEAINQVFSEYHQYLTDAEDLSMDS